jgi:predicted nucleic acid-binding protein
MTSPPSAPPPEYIVDTTALRHFTLIGQARLLIQALGGTVNVPREVFDPDEDLNSPESLLSELGRTIRYVTGRRYADPDRDAHASRLYALRVDKAISVIDLTDDELAFSAELSSTNTQRRLDLAGRLGPGEAAVMAIAVSRNWAAVIDDGTARGALRELSGQTQIVTCQILLRTAVVALELIDSAEAQIIYHDLLSGGFRGPDTLWES